MVSKRSRKKSPSKNRSRSKSPSNTGYCVKCKSKRPIQGAKKKRTRNGRAMMCGNCPKCGTKMCRFIAG